MFECVSPNTTFSALAVLHTEMPFHVSLVLTNVYKAFSTQLTVDFSSSQIIITTEAMARNFTFKCPVSYMVSSVFNNIDISDKAFATYIPF